MKKKKRVFVMLLAILMVTILSVFLFPKLKSGYMGKTVTVFFPSSQLPPGTKITQENLKEKLFPSEFIDEKKVISDKEHLIDSYTTTTVFETDYFTVDKVAKKEEQALYERTNLIAITLGKLSSSVAAKISPGDRVNVYGYTEGYEGAVRVTFEDLQGIEVAYLVDNQGKNVVKNEEDEVSSIPAAVVLKVKTQQQANELLKLEYTTKIHLERVNQDIAPIQKEKGTITNLIGKEKE